MDLVIQIIVSVVVAGMTSVAVSVRINSKKYQQIVTQLNQQQHILQQVQYSQRSGGSDNSGMVIRDTVISDNGGHGIVINGSAQQQN